MKTVLAVLLALAATILPSMAQTEKSPREWVVQLGAGTSKERDAASEALLKLGWKARDDVQQALESPDPEVKWRARELWKKLRWLVMPDADDDVWNLISPALEKADDDRRLNKRDAPILDEEACEAFVKKHGAGSMLLLVEIRANNDKIRLNPRNVLMLLEIVPPADIARLISETKNTEKRQALEDLLDDAELTKSLSEKGVLNWMTIQIALGNYEKAYHLAHDHPAKSDEFAKTVVLVINKGGLLDTALKTGPAEIAAETNAEKFQGELEFFTTVYLEFGKKNEVGKLFDAAGENRLCSTASTLTIYNNGYSTNTCWLTLMQTLTREKMPGSIIKLLHDAKSAQALYMRSMANAMQQDDAAAEADWQAALAVLEATPADDKKETYLHFGRLVDQWNDPRAEIVWQKILAIAPNDTLSDFNAYLQLDLFLEKKHDYIRAADYYDKALQLKLKHVVNGILVDSKGEFMTDEEFQKSVDDLRAKAEKQKAAGKTKN